MDVYRISKDSGDDDLEEFLKWMGCSCRVGGKYRLSIAARINKN